MERNESFAAANLNDLAIRLAWAQVEIFADDIDRVQVLAAGDENSVSDLRIETDGQVLIVEQPQYGLSLNITESHWMQVCVRMPKSWNQQIHVTTVSGLLNARKLNGSYLELDTVSGDVHVSRITAKEIKMKTVSGDVRADELTAERLSARSLSGQIVLSDVSAKYYKCSTVNGEQRISQKTGFEQMELRSVSGDITLKTAVEKLGVSMRSVNGRVQTEGVQLTDAAGDPQVRITGVSADVKLIYAKQE